MVIEVKEKGSREFYEEVVNVVAQYGRLRKKPEAKLKNYFVSLKIFAVLLSVLIAVNLAMGIAWGFDGMAIAAVVVCAVALVFDAVFWVNLKKAVDRYLSDDRSSVVTLDEDGVELNKENTQTVRLAWPSIAFVRVFKESVCFVSADITGFILAVAISHRQEILDYLKENEVKVKVIE